MMPHQVKLVAASIACIIAFAFVPGPAANSVCSTAMCEWIREK